MHSHVWHRVVLGAPQGSWRVVGGPRGGGSIPPPGTELLEGPHAPMQTTTTSDGPGVVP